nr:hypothetical protein [Parabacteroides merdae]
AAIGIFNLRSRTRQVMNFANAIPMMNRVYHPSSPGCKGWQHGGVREIMCLFLPKKEIAFVE